MMEKLEYIPGDLVMTNGVPSGTEAGVVYRVTECDPNKTYEFSSKRASRKGKVTLENIKGAKHGDKGFLPVETGAWMNHLIPIPLTVRILEDSGWVQRNGEFSKNIDNHIFYIIKVTDRIWAIDLFSVTLRKIEFCHELQNLMFGLGLSMNLNIK